MSFCARLNHASICSMKNRVKINMSLVMCCNKGSPEHTNSSLRLSKTRPCHLSHCECVSAGSPPDSLLVLSDTKCVPALWRLIAPGSLVRVMPAPNTNEHIRIAVFSSSVGSLVLCVNSVVCLGCEAFNISPKKPQLALRIKIYNK